MLDKDNTNNKQQNANKREKPYPSEFKESAVKLATGSRNPISQTARELGINVNTLYGWIEQYTKPRESSMKNDEHHFDEIKRLKKELIRVIEERDLLKKAAAYFAREAR